MAHVLVVEESAPLRDLVARLLTAAGHRVVAGAPGARSHGADVVVAGTAHPAVLAPLRAAGVPVVLVTPVRRAVPGVRTLVRPAVRDLLDAVGAAVDGAAPRALPLAG